MNAIKLMTYWGQPDLSPVTNDVNHYKYDFIGCLSSENSTTPHMSARTCSSALNTHTHTHPPTPTHTHPHTHPHTHRLCYIMSLVLFLFCLMSKQARITAEKSSSLLSWKMHHWNDTWKFSSPHRAIMTSSFTSPHPNGLLPGWIKLFQSNWERTRESRSPILWGWSAQGCPVKLFTLQQTMRWCWSQSTGSFTPLELA